MKVCQEECPYIKTLQVKYYKCQNGDVLRGVIYSINSSLEALEGLEANDCKYCHSLKLSDDDELLVFECTK